VPGEAPVLIAAHPAEAKDTTGAGDAFCGAFISKWLASLPPADPISRPTVDLTGRPAADLAGAAEFATQVAATVVTRFGARPV
jgi:sugar/nucleoside kinase (ribokinase family)